MIKIQALAELIQADVIGDADFTISAPSRIEDAQVGEITFLKHAKYLEFLKTSSVSAVVTTRELVDVSLPIIWLVVQDPVLAFAGVVEAFFPKEKPEFKFHQYKSEVSAQIDSTALIGEGVYIGHQAKIEADSVIYPQVYIGNQVSIGSDTIIYPGARILDGSVIGDHCVIHANAVIGADGFGFTPKTDGSLQKVPQMGNVILGDYVEIGANTCIDRATLGSTIIHTGVKLDNLIQIGHNVQVKSHTVIAAQTGVAGSSQIGKHNMIGGQVGFAPHIRTADGVKINAQSGISKSIEKAGTMMTGTPAQPYMEYNRQQVFIKKLESKLKFLEQEINQLKAKDQSS